MNKTLDKNRQMKDSEVEWIGYIPQNWNIVNIKFIFSSITEKNKFLQSQNVLSLVKDIGVIPYSEKGDIGNKCSEDITRYNLVRPNDIVMNSMNVIIGSVGKSKYIGVVSPVYYVLRVRDEQNSFVNYYENVFKTRMFQQSLKGYGNGILEHRMRIPIHNLNKVNIPLPHLNEQQAIANYLDEQVLKIDELIAEQKQAIESWKAYKQSLITEKVTKGLNPSVEMKDSGIKWIGKIPNDWNLARVKDVSYCLDAKRVPISAEMRTTGNIPYWGAGNIVDYIDRYIFNEELVLLGEDGAPFMDKDRPVAFYINSPIWANNHIHVLRNKENIKAKYLTYSLNCVDYYPFIGGSIIPKLTQSSMKEIKLPLPSLQQQQAIVDYLDEKCSKIDRMIEQKQVFIRQLEEYKQSLIYECVTGKRCVL